MRAMVIIGILVLVVGRPALAHSVLYVGSADQVRDPNLSTLGYADFECMLPSATSEVARGAEADFAFGGACFGPGHVQPVADDQTTTIGAAEDLFNPASAFYCQDNNGDGLCGGDGDYSVPFCGSVYLHALPDDDPPAPPNWEPSYAVAVYIDGPINGSSLYTACAGDPPKIGSTGHVWHPE